MVAWRGSANAQNWIEDFEFDKVEYNCKGCEIHQGFFYDYLLVEEKTNEKVQALLAKYPTANILCTGHSMGAALSEISGIRLKAKFGRNVHVHNFGCPRIGNNNMAQYVANQVDTLYRVVHNRDLIPHLPPEPLEYHHSAFEVFFD